MECNLTDKETGSKDILVVVNHEISGENALLAHQNFVVSELARVYKNVVVLTGSHNGQSTLPNVKVVSTHWQSGRNLRNLWNLYKAFFIILPRVQKATFFFHMADLQAAFLSPLLRLMNIKSFLWYAHTHLSIYLRFANFWVDGIITSTSGSCPIKTSKVTAIGQGVDPNLFQTHIGTKLDCGVHIGRLDASKNYGLIFDEFLRLQSKGLTKTLNIFGEPSRKESLEYLRELKFEYKLGISDGTLKFAGGISKKLVPSVLAASDYFIHAYTGSLDKTLIEATLSRIPVVTINQEYINEFGRWATPETPLTLGVEFEALSRLSLDQRAAYLEFRYAHAASNHSLEHWVSKLVNLLSAS